jgi:hypothetical protein
MIPALTGGGLLPPGRYVCTLAEIRESFVDGAPNQDRREMVFSAFGTYAELVRQVLPGSVLWVDGGFVTHKNDPPKDVDVLILMDPGISGISDEALAPLLTTGNVTFTWPVTSGTRRLQPMGGLVDAFLVPADDAAKTAWWDGWWSSVNGVPGSKGYLEVAL